MRSGFYPPEGHDFVNTNDIRKLAEANQVLKETRYEGGVNQLRASVAWLLNYHQALGEHGGWAIFVDDSDVTPAGSGAEWSYRETLVIVVGKKQHNFDKPLRKGATVRMITNELVETEYGGQYYIQDVMVDEDGDSQYIIDAADLRSERGNRPDNIIAPLFMISEEKGLVISGNVSRPVPKIDLNYGLPGAPVIPFGHYSNYNDKLYALEKAEEIFQTICELTPSYIQAPSE